MASLSDSQEIFTNLSTRFTQVLHGRSEGDRNLTNKILDDLNSLDYRYPVVTNSTRAVLLVNQFCNLITPDDSFLVAKCCALMTNLVNRQKISVEGRTLTVVIDWILQALKQAQSVVTLDILITLDALLRSNTRSIHTLLSSVVTNNGVLLQLIEEEKSPEIVLLAIQCLEACCAVPDDFKFIDLEKYSSQHQLCADVFLKYLLQRKPVKFEDLIHAKLLISCLRGLENVIKQNDNFLDKELGLLLGIAKTYMVYKMNAGFEFVVPQKVLPSVMSVPDPPQNSLREKKGGKVTKLRKQRVSGANKRDNNKNDFHEDFVESRNNFLHGNLNLEPVEDDESPNSRVKTSDSDFSDSEGGRNGKTLITQGRVRQAALKLLLNICKNTDKKIMFSYWSSFIPAGPHSLTNCILKDPSPRGRMAALNVLLLLLSNSKLYLSQAEFSEKTSSFVPFSVILGNIIKDLHHKLCLALNESSYPVLTLVLKCTAALVQATPYHRLGPGLVSKIIRNVKQFITHKDSTVQVVALIVLGCVLASEPPIKETKECFLRNVPAIKNSESASKNPTDFDIGSEEDEEDYDGHLEEISDDKIPWLLDCCLNNLHDKDNNVPAPVKLESLRVISAMSRNHFDDLLGPFTILVTQAVDRALIDVNVDVRLHAGRTVDFIGQAMNQHLSMNTIAKINDHSLYFWQTLLNNSLVSLLRSEEHPNLRTACCDCIGSMGEHVFEQLPRDKQLLCITSLFACTRDDDDTVKGSAVRALAISVLYPTLREDPGFVMDTSEAIHRTLNEENLGLKIKSSWSLANLSNALVLNKSDPRIYEDIPDSLLLTLVNDSIEGCRENKIKSNTVRALGNLLQLIDERLIESDEFGRAVKHAIESLVECATKGTNMKVRWNACYALGNVLKNESLYKLNNSWPKTVLNALSDLVVGFKNFKVRINAALALASCPKRELYGAKYTPTWNVLLKALENSENMEDFSEYKHRDHLIEQICLSLAHLVTLMSVEDLTNWGDTFSEGALKKQMRKVYDHVIPEKSAVLFTATERLGSFKCQTGGQKQVLEALINVFNNDVD